MEREALKQKLADLYNCGVSESTKDSDQIDAEILAVFDALGAEVARLQGIIDNPSTTHGANEVL